MQRASSASAYHHLLRVGKILPAVRLAAVVVATLCANLPTTAVAQIPPALSPPPTADRPASHPSLAPTGLPSEPAQSDLRWGPAWSVNLQATFIEQLYRSFPSAYEGPNSFRTQGQAEHTFSSSLYLGRQLWAGGALFYNPEIFQGYGLSHTFGIAGFPNGEAVKSGFANLHYNTSRLFFRQTFGLGGGQEKTEQGANQFAGDKDVNRLVFSVGKFSGNDFFDDNPYSHDPRTQFMNWALWESAAWDYPADIVGFTGGAVVEWTRKNTTLRYGILMEPTEANGAHLDHHLGQAHGQILQCDYRYAWGDRHGTIRSFAYWNQARMGSYAGTFGQSYPADVTLTRSYRSKVGLGTSWDQELSANLGTFVRLSWNDGRTESFSFTEIDRSIAGGFRFKGGGWARPSDVAGLALAVNGLSGHHRRYLENGGTGLIIGDGALSYSPEEIVEIYYTFQPSHWLQLGPDFQSIRHPGYNAVRGPVSIFALRAHVEF